MPLRPTIVDDIDDEATPPTTTVLIAGLTHGYATVELEQRGSTQNEGFGNAIRQMVFYVMGIAVFDAIAVPRCVPA